jgi:hypothetical protein
VVNLLRVMGVLLTEVPEFPNLEFRITASGLIIVTNGLSRVQQGSLNVQGLNQPNEHQIHTD